jgi:DNA primase
LWLALPDGALRRQLLPELARQAQMDGTELAAMWEPRAAPPAPARVAPPAWKAPARSAARRAPAGLADQALRLLLRHSDWWERLSGDDHALLHELGGTHGEVLAWLERQLTEHGAQTAAALDEALADEPWADTARGWLRAADVDETHAFDDLHRVLQRMWIQALGDDAQLLASGEPDAEGLARLRQLRERIAALKAALTTGAQQAA